jgi:hypothetical protein
MGTRRLTKAVVLAAVLCAGARAVASVQVDPIARLSLEGGYDSNVLYDGRGAGVGRVAPDLGFQLRDHTWTFGAVAGGDLLAYPSPAAGQGAQTVWNQRGTLVLHLRPTPRFKFDGDAAATYAYDPVGLARLGIFGTTSTNGLVARAGLRGAWRLDPDWTVAGTFAEYVVRFGDGTGSASHTPGVELAKRLGHRLEMGGVYKFDYFQSFTSGAGDATAHELQWLLRYRWARHLTLEAMAGPALWNPAKGSTQVLPQAMAQILGTNRIGDVRLTVRHGVGLGIFGTPGLFDSAEGAFTWKVTQKIQLHADGGVWRSGDIPWGANSATGYGLEGELAYFFLRNVKVALAASRFARVDAGTTLYDRNIVGLRFGWELRHR